MHRSAVGRRARTAALVFAVCAAAVPGPLVPSVAAASSDLFFSEYVEGSSNNKALEIYNGTAGSVNLGTQGYNVQMFFNGSLSAGLTVSLSGTVAEGDVFVLAQATASAAVLDRADQTNTASWYNGDDAVVLRRGTTIVDVIGQIGFDPGTEWGTGVTSTADNTLRRKPTVTDGDTNGSNAFDPAGEWDGFATDTFTGLGTYGDAAPRVTSTSPAADATNVPIGSDITITFSEAVSVSGTWVSVDCSLSGAHAVTESGGPQTYTLDPSTPFANDETCTVVIDGGDVHDADAADPPDTMAADHSWTFRTVEAAPCERPFTPIPVIQGAGSASPAVNQTRTTEGVVVADMQATNGTGLSGFFIQDIAGDGSVTTSDGIFVFVPGANPLSSTNVSVGDEVRVSGTVREFQGLTEIDTVSALLTCGTVTAPSPTVVNLPEAVNGELERYEGMLVTIPETLTVQQNFFLGRYGQLTLGANGRAITPTNEAEPGSPEYFALADEAARRLIVLDDARSGQNPAPIPFLGPDGTVRAGDRVAGLTGALDFGPINSNTAIRDYRVQPTSTPTFTYANARTSSPEDVGGRLRVASFNVLNFFNGNGTGQSGAAGGFPTARGANTLAELDRQTAKIVAALKGLDADVVGLIELENDGDGSSSAIQELVDALNEELGAGTYAHIADPATGPGTDEIKVGLIYRPAAVTPVGASLSDPSAIHDRKPVAQTFQDAAGARFSVVANHFKSKSSCPAPGDPNADQGDGQGCWNVKRVAQAHALLTFLDELATVSGDEDILVVGDLNAYSREDPIEVLKEGGLIDLAEANIPEPYSYVFDGLSGELDHALGTASVADDVTDVTIWHINADEPSVIDYNTEFKPHDLYAPTPYRSSDHDPALVGLALDRAPVAAFTWEPITGTPELDVAFDAAGSADPDGGPLDHEWDFGDGSTGSGEAATHTYADPGSYQVTLTVTDEDGSTDSITHEVTVRFEALQDLVRYYEAKGDITSKIAAQLITRLDIADSQLAMGHDKQYEDQLTIFINEVEKRRGRGISPAAADALIAEARARLQG